MASPLCSVTLNTTLGSNRNSCEDFRSVKWLDSFLPVSVLGKNVSSKRDPTRVWKEKNLNQHIELLLRL
jgi:hypothetical protein